MDDIKLEEEEEECLMERDEDMEPASSTPAPNRDQDGQHSGSEEDDDEDDGISVKIGKISYLPRALRHPLSAPVGNKPQRPPEGGEVKVDEDGAPLVDGKRIYDTDLGKLLSTPRPWTTPGINISDYFNYGFNEESWNEYCERHAKYRAEFGTIDDAKTTRAILDGIKRGTARRPADTGPQAIRVIGVDVAKMKPIRISKHVPPPTPSEPPVLPSVQRMSLLAPKLEPGSKMEPQPIPIISHPPPQSMCLIPSTFCPSVPPPPMGMGYGFAMPTPRNAAIKRSPRAPSPVRQRMSPRVKREEGEHQWVGYRRVVEMSPKRPNRHRKRNQPDDGREEGERHRKKSPTAVREEGERQRKKSPSAVREEGERQRKKSPSAGREEGERHRKRSRTTDDREEKRHHGHKKKRKKD